MSSLRHRTFGSLVWNGLERGFRLGFGLVVTAVLAHLLVPSDMGIVAMGAIFIILGRAISAGGFAEALIRKQDATDLDYSTTFWTNLGLALAIYCTIFLLAPRIGQFYTEPRITPVVRVSALAIIISALNGVQGAILRKRMDFRRLMIASVPAGIVAGLVAILLAYLGWSYWSLVVQGLLATAIAVLVIWFSSDWRPSFRYDWRSARELFGFGSRIMLVKVIQGLASNMVVIVIAKTFGSAAAGLYFFAERIFAVLVGQTTMAVQSVTYPALASIQSDEVRLREGYRRLIRVMTFAIYPLVTWAIAVADLIFLAILPSRWAGSVPILQLLCVAGFVIPLAEVFSNALQVKGKANQLLAIEIGRRVMLLLFVLIGSLFGLMTVVTAQVGSICLGLPVLGLLASRLLGYGVPEQLRDTCPALFLAIVAALLGTSLRYLFAAPPLVLAIVITVAIFGSYLTMAKLFRLEALGFVLSLLENGWPRSSRRLRPSLAADEYRDVSSSADWR
jgi:O-antigen/teichoic acid export membrane protein